MYTIKLIYKIEEYISYNQKMLTQKLNVMFHVIIY